jgi:hypothetical protein
VRCPTASSSTKVHRAAAAAKGRTATVSAAAARPHDQSPRARRRPRAGCGYPDHPRPTIGTAGIHCSHGSQVSHPTSAPHAAPAPAVEAVVRRSCTARSAPGTSREGAAVRRIPSSTRRSLPAPSQSRRRRQQQNPPHLPSGQSLKLPFRSLNHLASQPTSSTELLTSEPARAIVSQMQRTARAL